MYVRLGFAVAVHVDPDILLVDEVLAVGDEHFQRKCLDKIAEFQDQGRTILFVSHSSALVEQVCSRAVVLDHGRGVFDGDPYFASHELRRILGTDTPSARPDTSEGSDLAFGRAVFSAEPGGPEVEDVEPGEPLTIRVPVTVGPRWVGEIAAVRTVVMGVGDIPIWAMTMTADDLPREPGEWLLDFTVPRCPPLKGRFVVATELSRAGGEAVAASRSQHAFGVAGRQRVGLLEVEHAVHAQTRVDA
jgi:ABC-2 type transport system ATP-binding protein